MSNGCSFDLSDAYQASEDLFFQKEINSINDLFPIFDDLTETLKQTNIDTESLDFEDYLNGIRDLMLNDFEMKFLLNLATDENYSFSSFKSRFIQVYNDIEPEASQKVQSAESLVSDRFQAESYSPNEIADKFINLAYKTADTVRLSAVKQMRTFLFDSCFVNRGLTDLQGLEDTSTKEGLNNNIRIFQLHLFNRIMDFIETFNDLPDEIKNLDRDLYVQDAKGNWISTKSWEKAFNYISTKLNPDNYLVSKLNELYNSKEEKDKIQLNALNAYVFLSNFDNFLKNVFGDAIHINRFGIKDGSDKYSFSSKTGNQTLTWRKDDNVFIEDESDVLTKLLIETTPLLKDNEILRDRYLTFQDVAFVFATLKLWATNPYMSDITFNDGKNRKRLEKAVENGLISEQTEKILNDCKTLPVLIASLRLNFQKYMPAISELLSSGFLDSNTVMRNLSDDVRIRLNTVLKSFFSRDHNSIYSLNNPLQEKGIYKNLCQTLDSVFKNIFTTVYQDEDGMFYNRLLSDLAEYKTRIAIESNINVKHSPGLLSNFIDSFKNKYGYLDTNSVPDTLTFKLNPKLEMQIDKKTENVILFYVDGNEKTEIKDSRNIPSNFETKFKELVFKCSDDLIGTTFLIDPGYFNIFASKDSEPEALLKLLRYGGRILNRIYISNVDLRSKKTISSKIEYLRGFYGDLYFDLLGFDRTRKQINLHGKNVAEDKQIRLSLAKSLVEHKGLLTESIVNNSEGKAQSNNALSKLLGSFFTQWNLQEKTSLSATRDFDLLNVSGLFVKNYITHEVYSKYDGFFKKAVAMTPAEFSQVNMLFDFIPALFDIDSSRLVSNSTALFIASINSDKGTISKIEVDLSKTGRGMTHSYKDASAEEIKQNIALNFGEYYSNMLDAVLDSYSKLKQFMPEFLAKKGLVDPKLANLDFDYVDNFGQFNLWFHDLNTFNKTNYKQKDFLNELVREHNKANPLDLVELVQNIHTNWKDGELIASNTILGLIYRFNYRGKNDLVNQILLKRAKSGEWSTLDQFFGMKELELVGSLLEDGTSLNVLDLPPVVLDLLKSKYNDWIDNGGNLIIAKINGKNYSTKADIFPEFKHVLQTDFDKLNGVIEINPLIQKLNLLHYLFTQLWMDSTVGSFTAHPGKVKASAKSNELKSKYSWLSEMYLESAQFIALSKRNVSFTALMQLFQLNTLFGINSKYKIAVIEDLHHAIDVLTSKQNRTTPFDGATIASPFTVYLENNSLGGNTSGLTKKTFVHFKNEKVGNGGIIKTAVFGLSNDNMRQSPDTFLNLHYKMSSLPWTDQNGELIDLDLTSDYLNPGEKIKWPADLYFHKGHLRYLIVKIEKNPYRPYSYIRTIRKVTSTGEALQDTPENLRKWQLHNPEGDYEAFLAYVNDYNKDIVEKPTDNVNNNYAAWELFGGLNSMELRGKNLVLSENSIKALVECMNRTGIQINENRIETLDDFYQPMKHSQIQYVVTEGAIKQGAANMNSSKAFTDDTELMTLTILMLQAGTQLDKEHHADLAEVSLPTQIITACSALGYSFDNAENLYNGIASIADLALKLLMQDAQVALDQGGYDNFLNQCTRIIIDNLANSSTLNFGTYLAESILQAARAANVDTFDWTSGGLPISDNTVFNRAINALCNYMTKNAIKIKMPGSLAIMTPSYKTVPIYGDRKFSDYMDPFKDIRTTLFTKYDLHPVFELGKSGSVADVDIDYTYKLLYNLAPEVNLTTDSNTLQVIYNGLEYFVNTNNFESNVTLYKGGFTFSNDITGFLLFSIYDAIRLNTRKRRPKTRMETDDKYNIRINQEAFDEFEVVRKSNFTLLIYHKKVTLGNSSETDVNYFDLRNHVESGLISKITEYIMNGRDLASYNVRFEGSDLNGTDKFSIWDLRSVQELHRLDKNDPNYLDAYNRMLRDLQILSKASLNLEEKWKTLKDKDLKTIYNESVLIFGKELVEKIVQGDENKVKDLAKLYENAVTIAGPNGSRVVKINKDSVQHRDYEIVMPKVFKTIYNLEEDTCLATIENNPNYFVTLIIRNREPNFVKSQYCLEIKNSNGKHTYIGFEGCINIDGFTNITNNVQLMIDEDGRIFRLDEDEEPMYEIKPGTLIFTDTSGNEILILQGGQSQDGETLDKFAQLEYYLKLSLGYQLKLSDSILKMNSEDKTKVLSTIINSKWNKRYILHFMETPNSLEHYIEQLNQLYELTEEDLKNANKWKKLKWDTLSQELQDIINRVNRSVDYINGREKYTSFLESLKIIAARIPAQNMLSFMGMKVVAFSNGDRNTAYVSDALLFLLGSDFDIDSVTLLSFDINRDGKLDLWSPFASVVNSEALQASKNLPLPTGRTLDIASTQNEESEKSESKENRVLAIIKSNDIEVQTNYLSDYLDLFNFIKRDNLSPLVKRKNIKKIRKLKLFVELVNKLLRTKDIMYYDQIVSEEVCNNISEKVGMLLSTNDIKFMFDELIEIINEHNNYLATLDTSELRRVINNSNLHNMYEIITDTVNLSQSMTSVDAITEPVKDLSKKSSKASEDLYMSPGNSHSYGVGINNNYTGKDCIAKSASSLKAYFKLTHYFNSVLNSGNEDALSLLLIDPDIIAKCGKYASLIANVKAKDPSSVVKPELLENLLNAKTSKDAAAELSALLGLSADNAKELVLAKINAGIDMIGLYLYGISIGFDITALSEVLMSPTANVLHEAMGSNFLKHKKEQDVYSIFDYFKWGPVNDIDQFNKLLAKEDNSSPAKEVMIKLLEVNENINKGLNDGLTYQKKKKYYLKGLIKKLEKNESLPISSFEMGHAIAEFIDQTRRCADDRGENPIDRFNTIMYEIQNLFKFEKNSIKDNYIYNCLNFIKEFGLLKLRLDMTPDIRDTLHVLATGSKSMQMIGSIASLNLGIPGDLAGFLNKVNTIENYVQELYKLKHRLLANDVLTEDLKKSLTNLKIDLSEFVFDSTYRNKQIEKANSYKVNFNLFHLIDVLPDVKQYVNALGLVDRFFKKKSSRYAYIRKHYDELQEATKLKSDKLISGMSRYMLGVFILEYLKHVTLDNGFTFPKVGLKKFDSNGLITNKIYTTGTAGLDNIEGLALFKQWMESMVIPDLKAKSENRFIQGLTGISRSNTISGDEVIAYSLPINMMPKKEGSNEDIIFKDYLASFNAFTDLYKVGNKYIPAKDLLFYYTLVAFEWKPAQNSLMLIFKSDILLEGSKVKDYFEYVAELEKLDSDTIAKIYDNALFLTGNPYESYGTKYIYELNEEKGYKELWKNTKSNVEGITFTQDDDLGIDDDLYRYDVDDQQDVQLDENGEPIEEGVSEKRSKYYLKNYIKVSSVDPNYFPFGSAKSKFNRPLNVKELLRAQKIQKENEELLKRLLRLLSNWNEILDKNGNIMISINTANNTIVINPKISKIITEDVIRKNYIKRRNNNLTVDQIGIIKHINNDEIESCSV